MKARTTLPASARTNNNETFVKDPAGLKVKTHIRGGAADIFMKRSRMNNNETLVKDPKAAGLKIKTRVRAGAMVKM